MSAWNVVVLILSLSGQLAMFIGILSSSSRRNWLPVAVSSLRRTKIFAQLCNVAYSRNLHGNLHY